MAFIENCFPPQQDIFWYLFLDKFQSSKNSQVKLFNRAAFNYVKLMLYVRNPQYRDVFFKVWKF